MPQVILTPSSRDLRTKGESRVPVRASALTILLSGMIVAGVLQNSLVALIPQAAIVTNVDDLLLILAVLASIPRLNRVRGGAFAGIAVVVVLTVLAVLRSSVHADVTLELARAVAVPALLVLVGLTLLREEFLKLAVVWVASATLNAAYMILEMFGVRLIDPIAFLQATGSNTFIYSEYGGLPGAYIYWNADGSIDVRAGGLLMNPPIAGTMVAIALVVIMHMMKNRSYLKWALVLVNITALYASQGRGGMVIVAVGVLLPWVVRRVGLFFGAGILLPVGVFGYTAFSSAGDSISHVEGLTHGVEVAFTSPLGEGFGTAGNAVKLALRSEESSESLIGFALVAAGLPLLVVLVLLLVALLRRMSRKSIQWEQYLGLGAIVSSLLSESSGALAGGAFMWLALGMCLAAQPGHARLMSDVVPRGRALRASQ